MSIQEDRRVYTVNEVAEILRVHRESVYDAVKRRELRSVRLGKRILIPVAELQRLLAGEEATA